MVSYGPGYLDSADLQALGIAAVGRSVMVHATCILVGLENIRIGDHVRIDPFCSLIAENGHITIGSYVHIGAYALLSGGAGIQLDDFVGISQGVRIYSRNEDYGGSALTNPAVPSEYRSVTEGPVYFGRHVIIGSGAVVLPQVTVEEGTAVGALSLVTRTLECWGVYAGIPAKRLRDRSQGLLALEAKLCQNKEMVGNEKAEGQDAGNPRTD